MKNFPFIYKTIDNKELTLWYSRSVAVGLFLFAKDQFNEWCVLACQRGSGAGSEVDKWNCPGGFVDFDETIYQAALRECYEETGVMAKLKDIKLAGIDSGFFNSDRQTISIRFYYISDKTVEELSKNFSFLNNEENECKKIKFINMYHVNYYDWAFDHHRRILEIYDKYIVKKSIWSRLKEAWNIIRGKYTPHGEDGCEFV